MAKAIHKNIIPKLNHANKTLVFTSAKFLISFGVFLKTELTEFDKILAKSIKALSFLLNDNDETSYIILKFILAIRKRFPNTDNHLEVSKYFCHFQDWL